MLQHDSPVARRNFFALSALAASVASLTPAGLASANTSTSRPYDKALFDAIEAAKAKVKEGETLLVTKLEDVSVWVQKIQGKTFTQITSSSDKPAPPEALARLIAESLSKRDRNRTQEATTMAYSGNTCTLAYAIAAAVVGMGGLALAALALSSPGGAVIAGYYFTAAELSHLSILAGSYSLVVGWVGNFVC